MNYYDPYAFLQQQQQQQHQYPPVTSIANARGGGNNPYGSAGTVKCETCRQRRKKVSEPIVSQLMCKCEFDVARPDLPCHFCAQNNLPDCNKVPAPGHSGSPPMSQSGSDNGLNLSSYNRLSQYAAAYESQYPTATILEVLQYLNSLVSEQQCGYYIQSPNIWGI